MDKDRSRGLGLLSSAEATASPTRQHTTVSFFAGCGGLDLGFRGGFLYHDRAYERLPFHVVAAYDNDRKCKRTYDANFELPQTTANLASIDVADVPRADVLLGGFPCQEFSACGPQGGVLSHRGGLFRAMSRYARFHRPKVIVGENVPNLAFINEGKDLETIKHSLNLAGYRVLVWPVSGPKYGVPQFRQRLVIIGVRSDLEGVPQRPAPVADPETYTTSWAIGDLKYVTDDSVPNQNQYFKAGLAKRGHGQGDERNSADSPAYSIRANSRSRVQFHYELPRRLTVRECARLQTFPDTFVFPDEATPSIRQIGNAVPPVLAHAIGVVISRFLDAQVA